MSYGEQIGGKLVGSTTTKQLFKSAVGPNDVVACVIVGNSAATYPMGAAMRDGANGLKVRYTNSGSLTGACILMQDVTTTVGGGNVTADACRDGSVDKTMVVDANGALVDSGFKGALPKVTFD
jgi:hypothetical protein